MALSLILSALALPSLALPSAAQSSAAQSGAAQSGAAQSGQSGPGTVQNGLLLFHDTCFSPHLTAQKLREQTGALDAELRVEFYDLLPFSAPQTSPVSGRPATPGTDRRCEVAFDGDAGAAAAQTAADALAKEGITAQTAIPDTHADAALSGTTLLGARKLNPSRIAIVHTGTRPGPNGTETFLMVERLTPSASLEALQ